MSPLALSRLAGRIADHGFHQRVVFIIFTLRLLLELPGSSLCVHFAHIHLQASFLCFLGLILHRHWPCRLESANSVLSIKELKTSDQLHHRDYGSEDKRMSAVRT